jgi:tRNA G18 (ribose-2'-O)-methylase SpoU
LSANQSVTLVGDGIENPANALTMIHAAAMFGAECRFRDTKGLAHSLPGTGLTQETFVQTTGTEIRALHERILAFDNLPGARELYGFHAGLDFAVLVGNERRGLSHEFASLATDQVHVPMVSRRINCLNVAAASAVALYYLNSPPVGPMAVRKDPRSRRPELLLLGAADHLELGSSIRSAAAFGWERAFIEDSHRAWFGSDRATRSQGRAAARRGKNEILLVPCPPQAAFQYPRATVITCQRIGVPLHRAKFAGGPGQLVVLPDESHGSSSAEDWSRFGRQVDFAHLQLPTTEFTYHYRLVATIALAEISRQVGRRPAVKALPGPRPPIYDSALEYLAQTAGELLTFEDLLGY